MSVHLNIKYLSIKNNIFFLFKAMNEKSNLPIIVKILRYLLLVRNSYNTI